MAGPQPIVADVYTYVVGVDTHAATHHYAIIEARTGGLIDHAEFPTHTAGLLRAADWIARRTAEATAGEVDRVLVSIEGTRSYGAQLTAVLSQTGYRVVDAPTPKRERGSGKNDQIDAVVAARGSLHKHLDQLADARSGETSATLQVLLSARNSITGERTRAINALTALLRVHDLGVDALLESLEGAVVSGLDPEVVEGEAALLEVADEGGDGFVDRADALGMRFFDIVV